MDQREEKQARLPIGKLGERSAPTILHVNGGGHSGYIAIGRRAAGSP
jgi:hypothetical protein